MPAFNAAPFIGSAIESVLTQTHPAWELIVVDDGSTDDTRAVAERFAKQDNRITVLQQSNKKQGPARNLAIRHAQGEWLAFLDADDYWVPEKLSRQLHTAHETNAKWIFSNAQLLEQETGEIYIMGAQSGWLTGKLAIEKMLHQNCIPLSTVLIEKQLVVEAGGFTEQPAIQNAEDYHLWCRLFMKDIHAYGMPAQLTIYRMHAAAATASDRTVLIPLLHARADLAYIFHPCQQKMRSVSIAEISQWLTSNYSRSSEKSQALFGQFKWLLQQEKIQLPMLLHWPFSKILPGRIIRKQFSLFHALD